jgi:hypothetical protein
MSAIKDDVWGGSGEDHEPEIAWMGLDANGQLRDMRGSAGRAGESGPVLSDGDLLARLDR